MAKILLIEDNDALREEIIDFLKFESYTVCSASGGLDGIEQTFLHKPDLILCDIVMPDIDGFEVRRQLKLKQETSMIPFVFLTALSGSNDVRKGMELGADDYLTKPVSLDKLKNAIETRLEKSEEFRIYLKTRMDELREKIIRILPHELLTPLNVILGFAEIIKHNTELLSSNEIIEMALAIEDSGKRLHELINNYLTYVAEVSKNNVVSDSEIVRVNETATKVSTHIANRYSRENDLIIDVESATLTLDNATLTSEDGDFEFLIKELVDNAFKFSDCGSKVSIIGRAFNDGYKIIVKDHGVGFPFSNDSILSEVGVFNQFNREKMEQQGSGLGLITSLLIVERNNGTLNICNEEVGASVTLILPTA